MTTLTEHIIVVGAENRPPMLEKLMYDLWSSHIRLFIKGKKHGRTIVGIKRLLDDLKLTAAREINAARHNLQLLVNVNAANVKVKKVNGEQQLQALVDGKKIVVTEVSVRRDLQLDDEEGMDYLPNATIFE
ncbi:hypothetical protein Tco_0415536 [Tanacetum coccineum]